MSDVLTPQLALSYLGELQPALTGVAIFDHDGRLVAGEDVDPTTLGGDVATVTARGERHSIRAAAPTSASGSIPLPALTNLDLDTVLDDLE